MNDELQKLLEQARMLEMTPASKERQRLSFAYGNANIENQDVTRETVARMAQKLSTER